jgi:hypothetical protein
MGENSCAPASRLASKNAGDLAAEASPWPHELKLVRNIAEGRNFD